jgi:serine/threonine-protein kinase
MLTGRRPFRRPSALEEIIAIDRDPPEALSSARPEVPKIIADLVLRCLEKEPARRPENGRALVRELDAAKSGETKVLTGEGLTHAATERAVAVSARSKRPQIAVSALGAVAIVAALYFGLAKSNTPPNTTSSSASASATASVAPHATTLTDLPAPASTSAEAKAAYAAGLLRLRDGTWSSAKSAFAHAVELDPDMAEAHLRLAIGYGLLREPELARAEFELAYRHRDKMSERDRIFLDAAEPITQRLQPDRSEAGRRFAAMTAKFPEDAEAHAYLALMRIGDPDASLKASGRALELDPKYADAWQLKGEVNEMIGRLDEARAAYEQGAAASSSSGDPLSWLTSLEAREGRCDAALAAVRRMHDREADHMAMLPAILYAKGTSLDTVGEALRQEWAGTGDAGQVLRAWDDSLLATLTGDFDTARARGEELAKAVSASNVMGAHYAATLTLVRLALETGRDAEAGALAYDFAARFEIWAQPCSFEPLDAPYVPWILRVATRDKRMSSADFEAKRTAWIDSERSVSGAPEGLLWIFGYAAPAETADEARAAIAAKARFDQRASTALGIDMSDALVGKVERLAGDITAATRDLQHAAAGCFALVTPIEHTWALFDLGQALEDQHDTTGACDAYGRVLARWGKAKPKSVTADKARARRTALRCDH